VDSRQVRHQFNSLARTSRRVAVIYSPHRSVDDRSFSRALRSRVAPWSTLVGTDGSASVARSAWTVLKYRVDRESSPYSCLQDHDVDGRMRACLAHGDRRTGRLLSSPRVLLWRRRSVAEHVHRRNVASKAGAGEPAPPPRKRAMGAMANRAAENG